MSLERLQMLALACEKREARHTLRMMVAANGNPESWDKQRDAILKLLNEPA